LFSSRSRHTIFSRDWSSDVCSSDLDHLLDEGAVHLVDQASRLKARTDLVEGAARLLGRGQSELDAADLGLVLDLAGYQLDGHLAAEGARRLFCLAGAAHHPRARHADAVSLEECADLVGGKPPGLASFEHRTGPFTG